MAPIQKENKFSSFQGIPLAITTEFNERVVDRVATDFFETRRGGVGGQAVRCVLNPIVQEVTKELE